MSEFRGTARFAIERRLGAGGMGVVYAAHDRERGARVALKTLKDWDAEALYLFKKEFRSLADISHPNLVSLGELFCEDGQWFFTMELVEGTDFLAHVRPADRGAAVAKVITPLGPGDTLSLGLGLASGGSGDPEETAPLPPPAGARNPALFDEPRLRAALLALADAVAALHRAGKVHRDLKPSNVLVTPEGRVVVLDFGLVADAAGRDVTLREGRVSGTPAYMAPEQAAGAVGGPPADWYAVGAVLYRALTGVLPIEGASPMQICMRKQLVEAPPARTLTPEAPADLDALCRDLLRIDPAARPRGAEVLARLRAAKASPAPAAATMPATATATAAGTAPIPRSPSETFVGRERELAILRDALARSRRKTTAVLVRGESGLGKTALVRRFLEDEAGLSADGVDAGRDRRERRRPDESGNALVLAGRCYERESVPYKAFDGIVDALSHHLVGVRPEEAARFLPRERDAAMLARLFPVLRRVPAVARVPAALAEGADPGEQRTQAFRGLRELLWRLADSAPLVLFVDDLQWTDPDSLVLLDSVLDPPDAPALLILGTLRSSPPPLPCEVVDIELAPLDAAESQKLARLLLAEEERTAVAPSSTAPTLADAELVAAEAHGHPLFIHELARHASGAARTATSSGAVAPRLDEALKARVASLPAPSRRLVEVVAVAGAPIPLRAALAAAGLSAEEGSKRVAELRVGHLVRTLGARDTEAVEPYHDRVRESVVTSLDDTARRALCLGLADALERAGAAESNPNALLQNLEAAGETARAALYAERAAERAARALAFDRAAELYRKALDLGHPDPERARTLGAALAAALAGAGRGPEAARAFLAAADGADPVERLRRRTRAAHAYVASGHLAEGLEVGRAVLAEVGVGWPRTQRRALFRLLVDRALLRIRGLAWKERGEGAVPARDLLRIDALQAMSTCLGPVDTIRAAVFQTRALRLALAAGERRRVAQGLSEESDFLSIAGTCVGERCRRLIAEVRRLASIEDHPELLARASLSSGYVAFFAGRFREAAGPLAEAEGRVRDRCPTLVTELATVRIIRLWALWHLGAIAEVRGLVLAGMRDARERGDRFSETSFARLFNAIWLVADEPAAARAQLEKATWVPPEGGFHMQHWWALLARSELVLYEGRLAAGRTAALLDDLAAVDRSMLTRMQVIRAYLAWLRGRLALAGTPPGPAEAEAEARRLEREGAGYARAWGRLLEAGAAATRGDRDGAAARLRDALALAETEGLRLVDAIARRRLGALVGGERGAALGAEAHRFFAAEGVKDSARLADVYAPGFAASRP